MIVIITNLTDGPGKTPTQVDIYNKTVEPGGVLNIPAGLIDAKLRNLEKSGLISIGSVPSWYTAAKAKLRAGRILTSEERAKRVHESKPIVVVASQPEPEPSMLVLADEVTPPFDELRKSKEFSSDKRQKR